MSAEPIAITAREVAKGLSMFEIDEALEALVEAAEQEAEANNGEISEEIKDRLGDATPRRLGTRWIASPIILKAQKAEAEIAQRGGANASQARHKAAENREKRLKQMLVWFMTHAERAEAPRGVEYNQPAGQQRSLAGGSRHDPHPGQLLSGSGRDYVAGVGEIVMRCRRVRCGTGSEWRRQIVQKELQRGILSDALARGEVVEGVSLVKGIT